MNLLERVQYLCKLNNTNPSRLEQELGFGKGTLYKWSNRYPNSEMLLKVANYFGVSVDYLMGREESLEGVYLSLAKDAQESGIDPDDIKAAIDMIKKFRNQE